MSIDGDETLPDGIGVLHQREPMPGDHTFTLAVTGLSPRQRRDLRLSEGEHHLDDQESERLLVLLDWQILDAARTETPDSFDIFLNRASVATVSGDTIMIRGIASSVVRA